MPKLPTQGLELLNFLIAQRLSLLNGMGTATTKQVVYPNLNNYPQEAVQLTSPSLGGTRHLSPELAPHALARTAVVSDKGGDSEAESSSKSEMDD